MSNGVNTVSETATAETQEINQHTNTEPITNPEGGHTDQVVGIEPLESQREHERRLKELDTISFSDHLRLQTEETRLKIAELELEKAKVDLERERFRTLMVWMMQQ